MRRRRCPPGSAAAGPGGPAGPAGPAGPPGAALPEGALAWLVTVENVILVPSAPALTPFTDPDFLAGPDNVDFTHLNGVLTFIGPLPRRFHVVGNLSASPGTQADVVIFLAIAVNGAVLPTRPGLGVTTVDSGDVQNVTCQHYVLLNPGNTVGLAVGAAIGGNITANFASIALQG